ncbi:MAG: 2-isopropylmalate synthase [Bacilli bacterium]|nr:2-isopropylmalate synthase [Bacilli bacterium]
MKHKLRMTPEQVMQRVADGVKLACSYGMEVQFSAEDAGRTDLACGTDTLPTATIALLDDKQERHQEAAVGNGAVDAIFKAIERISQEKPEVVQYTISAVTGGADALGEVHIPLKAGKGVVNGRGVSTDVLEASARAYLDALNRIVKQKGAGTVA